MGAEPDSGWGRGTTVSGLPLTMKAGRVSTTGGPTLHSQHLVVFVLLGPRGSPRQGPHSGTPQQLAGMLLAVLGLALGQWDSPTPRKPPSPHNFQITWPFKKKPARTDPDASFFFSITFMCFQNRNASDLTCIASTLTHSEGEPAALPPISFYTTVYTDCCYCCC